MWRAKINASTAKYEAPDEVDPVVTLAANDEYRERVLFTC